jgi:nicotinate phosphoribosyltransferase
MAVGTLQGYEHAHGRALDLWQSTYPNALLLALTDTFSTEAFYKDFTKEHAEKWSGIRQDSGDPYVYAPRAKEIYEKLGVDYKNKKIIIFSDNIDVEKALKLKKQTDELGFVGEFLKSYSEYSC